MILFVIIILFLMSQKTNMEKMLQGESYWANDPEI